MSAVRRVLVIGGGVAGLVAAGLLARRGLSVVLLERAASVGGKLREVRVGEVPVDAGPTVLTMRWVFDELFASHGELFAERLSLDPVSRLARHAFPDGEVLDLFTDVERSAKAIEAMAGAAEADGYRRFATYAKRIYDTVEEPFLKAARPSAMGLAAFGLRGGMRAALSIDAHRTLDRALHEFFRDPRLLQLFGRYATYSGSSPYLAPATLNVIAHVERQGVYLVRGGMARLAEALHGLAERAGVETRVNAEVASIEVDDARSVTGVILATGERLAADVVVANADVGALSAGLFGAPARRAVDAPGPRSLSALVWTLVAATEGFPLVRHNVFFSRDYRAEFEDLFERGRLPREPTIYVCAQDRDDEGRGVADGEPERLLVLVNAPARGDGAGGPDFEVGEDEVRRCEARTMAVLDRMNLRTRPALSPATLTGPSQFESLFPGTGGALYGAASHGMFSALTRASSDTKLRGLYLAGGSVHPGAGVPMAALSGRQAAARVLSDLGSGLRSMSS